MACSGTFNVKDPSKDNNVDNCSPSVQNMLSNQIAEILNVSPRKLAEHESMVAELLNDEAVTISSPIMSSREVPDFASPVRLSVASKITVPGMCPGSPGVPTAVTPLTPPVTPKSQVKGPMDKNIATLVFFDLETTGLAHQIGKPNVQITELSMIAMSRKEFQKCTSDDLKDVRIMHKLCLCFKPRATVSPGAAKVTGLDNHKLNDEQPFNENAASLVISFLSHLPKPACLLAHNGISYDYPILKSELKRNLTHLPSDILIADTLRGIRDLGVPVFPPSKKVCKSVKFKNGKVSCGLENLHLYFFNKKPTGSHSSEGDCIALAKVCHLMKDSILPWLDANCTVIDTIEPLWGAIDLQIL